MKYLVTILLFCSFNYCFSQDTKWQISAGLGLSGVNQIVRNDIYLDGHIKFNSKNNLLDNKFRNDALHTGYIRLSKNILNGFFKNTSVDLSFTMYNFRSVFFKEDKFGKTFFKQDDTINTPNWLITKYTLPYAELGYSRNININKLISLKAGFFISYQIDYYGTSHLILYDSIYNQYSRHTFAYAKKYTNFEINHLNYGIRLCVSFYSSRRLHPEITWTQSLNDISREKFHLNQHANIWALDVGLTYNFYKGRREILPITTIQRYPGKIKYSISLNYVYVMKWHRFHGLDKFFYVDVPKNHTGSIQGDALYGIGRLFSGKDGKWDKLSIGISSEFIYLPFSGLHYVDYTYLGKINGLDQWLHHYEHDRYQFIYMVNGIKAKYEIKNVGFVSFMKAYPLVLHTSAQTQDLFINNKTGAYTYTSWEKQSTEMTRNPHFMTELMLGITMTKNQNFTFGYQWTMRSSFIQINDDVDNRFQAFRNVKIGWSIAL